MMRAPGLRPSNQAGRQTDTIKDFRVRGGKLRIRRFRLRPVTIRWNMVTPATVRITGSNSAELVKNGKRLVLRVSEPATVTMKTWSAVPEHAYDSPNPGTSMVGFEVTLPANASTPLTVLLLPESAAGRVITPNAALSRWP